MVYRNQQYEKGVVYNSSFTKNNTYSRDIRHVDPNLLIDVIFIPKILNI